jgi:hypothetical protein
MKIFSYTYEKLFYVTVLLVIACIYLIINSVESPSIAGSSNQEAFSIGNEITIECDDSNTTNIKTPILVLPEFVAKREAPSRSSFLSKHFSQVVNFDLTDNYFQISAIVHPHSFVFTLQPDIKLCNPSPNELPRILILCFVVVGADFFEIRSAIRNTWTQRRCYDEHDMQVFFIVGFSRNETANRRIREEAQIYKDILQENYYDRYHFMTAKIMGAFKWASTYCNNYHFLLRINDDIVVNTRRMISFLREKVEQASETGHGVFENYAVTNGISGPFSKHARSRSKQGAQILRLPPRLQLYKLSALHHGQLLFSNARSGRQVLQPVAVCALATAERLVGGHFHGHAELSFGR